MEPSATEPLAPPQSPSVGGAKPKGFDPANTQLCVQVLYGLRNGLAQALLYTEGTKQFERTIVTTHASLNALLEAIGNFKIGVAKSEALINGERVETPASMRPHLEYIDKIMDAAGTAGLKFERGLEQREVGPFLQLLARKKFPAAESSKVNGFLREQGITHIAIDELRYVALSEEQQIYTGNGPMPGTHAVAQKALSELVDATLASIEKITDSEAQTQLRAELTDQLIEKSDDMLENVLSTATKRIKTSCSESQAALIAVPQRDGKMLKDTLRLGKLLLDKGLPDSDEAVQSIRQILEQIVHPYQSHAEDILSTAPLDPETSKLLPEWLVRAHASVNSGSAAERVEGILRQSPNALLDEQMFAQIVDVLDELSVAAMEAEADQLAAHVAGSLHSPTKRERIKAVERLSFLLERSLEQVSNSVRIVEDGLLAACTHETCDEVMKLLLNHLCQRCVHHYKLGNFQRSAEYMEWIVGLEESSRSALKDEGANLARQARELLSKSDFTVTVVNDILEEGEKGKTAGRIAQVLGSELWVALLQRMRLESDSERSDALAARFKALGPGAVQLFFESLGKEVDGAAALRLLNLAPKIGNDTEVWAQIQPMLRHPDGAVCGAALAVVLNRDGESAVDALCKVLMDEQDPERRKVWIGSLARLNHHSAQQVLLGELDDAVATAQADEEMLIAILEALSSAKNAGVVRPIAALTSARTPPASKNVVIAALKALGPFYMDPLAIEILERARKDKDPEIARLALVCLRGIVAAEQLIADTPAPEAAPQPAQPAAQPKSNTVRKTRRGFEALAGNQVDEIFQVGTAGKSAPADTAPPATAPAARQKREDEPFINDLKATLEGRVQDLGLPTTVRIVGSKDGLLRIFMPDESGLEGRIYIRHKKVLNATCGEKTGMPALVALDALSGAHFAYYAATFSADAKLDIEIDKVQDALRRFRDQPDDTVFTD